MDRKMSIHQPADIEIKEDNEEKKVVNCAENSDNLAKLLAEIIVENIIKKYRNGRNRICEDK